MVTQITSMDAHVIFGYLGVWCVIVTKLIP